MSLYVSCEFRVGLVRMQVQEIVLSADVGCCQCQKRVADIMSRMSGKISMLHTLLYFEYSLELILGGSV